MGKTHFRTNALLKNIIGKDLITDDNIAILELVKNSFDAGSENVHIIFKNLYRFRGSPFVRLFASPGDIKEKELGIIGEPIPNRSEVLVNALKGQGGISQIVIQDWGIGMSEEDIVGKWLNIAYSEKKEKKEEYGRLLAGNKGVGRFSCDRLGRYLTLYTRKKGDPGYNKLFIDWTVFEEEGMIDFDIQDVEFEIGEIAEGEFEVETGYAGFSQGTILEISELRSAWPENKVIALKRQLERLINPNQAFKNSQFYITINAEEYQGYDRDKEEYNRINGLVKNRIFEQLNFKTTSITSFIDSEGKYITTHLFDRGIEVFSLKERNRFPLLKDISINLFYLNPYAKAYFTRQTGIRALNFGSVFLFINGFRIPPYGDEGDDWLGLEVRKGQGYARYLGAREVIGRIEVKDSKDCFQIISNRAGVVEDPPFKELRDGYFYRVFRQFERFVVEGIRWDSVPKEEERKIEEKVKSSGWDESQEKYLQDSLERNKNLFALLRKIVDTRSDDIEELKINEEFVLGLVHDQTEKAKEELKGILQEIASKSKQLSPHDLEEAVRHLAQNSDELSRLEKVVGGYVSHDLSKVQELENVRQELENKLSELEGEKGRLQESLRLEWEARQKAEQERLAAEAERERIARELELEKEKNTYLRTSARDISEDAKGLVHNIKITSKKISSSISNLYAKILDKKVKESDILKALGSIKFQADKAMKASEIVTRANFKADKTDQIIDIVAYINQYVGIYADIYERSILGFEVISNGATFVKKVSVLDISVVMDDLISNAEKAMASKVVVTMENPSPDSLVVWVTDNGKGVLPQFVDSPDKMFELGVTTTNGSGIGLHTVKEGLKQIGAKIEFVGNGVGLKGACFKITFN